MADKRPLTLNANGTKELLQPSNSLDIGGYTLPNTAGSTDDLLVMGAANAEWTPLSTVIDGNAYDKTGWDVSVFSEVTLTFTDGTRTVAIAPVGANASYYIAGTKYTFTVEQSVVIDDTEGMWYIYFDGSTLTASQTTWTYDDTQCMVMSLYWDATNNVNIGWQSDLHSWLMQQRLHNYLHDTFGTRFDSGLGVAEATTSTINVAIGKLFDEDVQVSITDEVGSGWWDQVLSPLTAPIYYRSGAGVWRKLAASTSLCYLDTNVPQTNIFSGTWQWAAVAVARYFAYWVVASGDSEYPVYLVPGQEAADKLTDTIAGNLLADMDFGGLPTAEHKVIARIILRRTGAGAYYEITQIDDYRYAKDENAGAGTTVSDHGGLTGLADDDHTQYHNDTRATTWIDAGFSTTGNITIDSDSNGLVLGDDTDYSVKWDGNNAVHTISKGAFEFDGGSIRLPTFTTTERDLLTPVEGFIIYNSTTISVEKYEDSTWGAGRYTLPTNGSPEDFLKRTALGYEWTTSFTSTLTVGAIHTTGNITIDSDSNGLVLGDDTDYSVKWDGGDAVHTISAGAFEFDGGAIRLPIFTTGERDALSPVNGMVIYNSTTDQFESYEDGSWVYNSTVTVKDSSVALYIKTTGDDETGDGTDGNPFASIDKALEYVENWIMVGGSIYIYIEKGDYPETDPLNIQQEYGHITQLLGDYETDTLELASSSGSSGAWSIVFNTINTSYYTVNDMVLVDTATGGSDYKKAMGTMKVTSIDPGVSVTLLSTIASATMASGAVTATVSIPQVKWNRIVSFKSSIFAFTGIQTHYNCGSTEVVMLNFSTSGYTYQSIGMNFCIWNNTNGAQRGRGRIYTNSSLKTYSVGFHNMDQGIYAFPGATFAPTNTGSTSCTYGFVAYGCPIASIKSHAISCTTGLSCWYMGLFSETGGGVYLDSNSTDAVPARNTEGNFNSYMTYSLA